MRASVFEDLSRRLHFETNILKERISPASLRKVYKRRLAVLVAENNIIPLCFAALWPTRNSGWFELGTMWIHPGCRGRHISGPLFDEVMKKLPEGKNVFLVARNMKVVHLAIERGWQEDKNWRRSKRWKGIYRSRSYGMDEDSKLRMPKFGRLFYKEA